MRKPDSLLRLLRENRREALQRRFRWYALSKRLKNRGAPLDGSPSGASDSFAERGKVGYQCLRKRPETVCGIRRKGGARQSSAKRLLGYARQLGELCPAQAQRGTYKVEVRLKAGIDYPDGTRTGPGGFPQGARQPSVKFGRFVYFDYVLASPSTSPQGQGP